MSWNKSSTSDLEITVLPEMQWQVGDPCTLVRLHGSADAELNQRCSHSTPVQPFNIHFRNLRRPWGKVSMTLPTDQWIKTYPTKYICAHHASCPCLFYTVLSPHLDCTPILHQSLINTDNSSHLEFQHQLSKECPFGGGFALHGLISPRLV